MELPTVHQDVSALAGALDGAEALRGQRDPAATAAEFERLLATLMVKELRRGLPEGFFGEGPGRDVFEGWLDEHLGSALADGDGLGLRVALERGLRGAEPAQAEGSGPEVTP